MKGEFTLRILEALAEKIQDTSDVLTVIMDAGYGASSGKLNYMMHKARKQHSIEGHTKSQLLRKRYHNLIRWLKKDGLIAIYQETGKMRITKKGLAKLGVLRERRQQGLSAPHYVSEKSNEFVIATFDVPEKQRIKRVWLRNALRSIGLTMLQKSVWVGKAKIPGEFLDDIARLNLTSTIEIFTISKLGSLRRISETPRQK